MAAKLPNNTEGDLYINRASKHATSSTTTFMSPALLYSQSVPSSASLHRPPHEAIRLSDQNHQLQHQLQQHQSMNPLLYGNQQTYPASAHKYCLEQEIKNDVFLSLLCDSRAKGQLPVLLYVHKIILFIILFNANFW
jgi:hypothetical protein